MRGGRETKNNAHRIARALALLEQSGNAAAIKTMAKILNYYEDQLLDDMHDLKEYIEALEAEKEN